MDRQVPVYLDFSRAKGSSNLSFLAVAGRKGIGMHFFFSKELQAKDVPTYINFGLKGQIGRMIAGLSAEGAGGRFKPEASADLSFGRFGFEGSKKPTSSEPLRLGVRTFREIGASKLSAFFGSNVSKSALPKGGISLDRRTRAFDISMGPENERAIAIIQNVGPKKYVSLIYSTGKEKRVMLEVFAVR